jgi:phosphate acetyltransferase
MIQGMETWPRLAKLLEAAQSKGAAKTGIVFPMSEPSLRAACEAHRLKIIEAVIYGPSALLNALAQKSGIDLVGIRIIDTPNDATACAKQAVADCKSGQLAALMKGSLHTDELLAPVVARDTGLRTDRRISHVFVFDVPTYPKLLMVADAVVNISPDLKSKFSIVQNAIDAALKIGVSNPKVAILAAVEIVQENIPATIDAAALLAMADEGKITGGILGGPFGFDNAVSKKAAHIKGITSTVAGDADILIAPDLNAGNILYKSLIYMAGAECAGVVLGTTVPIILTSRADSEICRIASCALASLLASSTASSTASLAPN